MLDCKLFYDLLVKNDIDFFAGVPDSLLKNFCAYITDTAPEGKHIIAANEGNAVSLACGHHLATKKIGLVYMQNSGQGNALNPLVSLADPDVYSIPVLLLIGWRGQPGTKDEPQHVKQGKITLKLLKTLNIPADILPSNMENAEKSINKALKVMAKKQCPYALIAKKDAFSEYKLQKTSRNLHEINREEAIKLLVDALKPKDFVVSTTGKTSRELFEYREKLQQKHDKDFLTVGSMGHASSIAMGIALAKPDKQIYCLDGDGAVIMHMGSLAVIGSSKPRNFKHIIINNGAHDSVGGQETAGFKIDISGIAKACGYKKTFKAQTPQEIKKYLTLLRENEGPILLEILVNKGARKDLGRPTNSPLENKKDFMQTLSI